jgi:hypothetical protein
LERSDSDGRSEERPSISEAWLQNQGGTKLSEAVETGQEIPTLSVWALGSHRRILSWAGTCPGLSFRKTALPTGFREDWDKRGRGDGYVWSLLTGCMASNCSGPPSHTGTTALCVGALGRLAGHAHPAWHTVHIMNGSNYSVAAFGSVLASLSG